MASRVIRFPIRAWLVAGLAAALVVGALSWRVRPARAGTSERYATDVTAQRRVALRDGSTVDLNVSSDVRILFTKDERRVSLSAGEAHFQVAHDTSRPFVVTAGGVSVRAVGTAFNVRLAGGAVDVLVVEGKVEVTRPMSPASDHADVRPLAAGERTQISRDDSTVAPTVEKIDPAAIRALLAWQERITSFVDVPLRDLVAQFNRRNATQLVIEDAALGGRTIGGVIAVDRVEAFVRLLEQDGDIIAERRRAGEIVLRRAR